MKPSLLTECRWHRPDLRPSGHGPRRATHGNSSSWLAVSVISVPPKGAGVGEVRISAPSPAGLGLGLGAGCGSGRRLIALDAPAGGRRLVVFRLWVGWCGPS